MVAAVALWLAHYVTGNPAQVSAELASYNNGEAVYEVQGKLGVHEVFVQGGSGACGCKVYINEGACGHVDAALLTHQQFVGRSSVGVHFTSVSEDMPSMPEEPEAIRRRLSALGEHAFKVFSGHCPEADDPEHSSDLVSVESLTELVSEGDSKPPDAGGPERSVLDAAPSSRNGVSSISRGKGLSVDSGGLEACRAKFLDGSGSLDKTLRVVRSGTEGDSTNSIWSGP